jgi:hypothetical protein
MARWHGAVGYGFSVETSPGVYEDQIVERTYFGDIIRNSRNLKGGDKVNNDFSVSNHISIVADPYANEHFFAIRYLRWMGALWSITEVEVQSPRLIFRLGGVYNGPKAPAADPA